MSYQLKQGILIAGGGEEIIQQAISVASPSFKKLEIINCSNGNFNESRLAELEPDLVLNFLGSQILRQPLLSFPCINFHPAPPQWPGRGSASLALFHGASHFGATAHLMVEKVDAGPIIATKYFPIENEASCDDLFSQGQRACLDLLTTICSQITETGEIPSANGEEWARKAITRKEFEQWLILDEKKKEEFLKKIKAASHPKFPGPYVVLHGFKFALVR